MNKIEVLERRIEGLETKLSKVKNLYEKTVSYSISDPTVSLQQARLAAEAICKQILSYELGREIGNMMLDKMITDLTAKKYIPKKMIIHVKSIQNFGNYGSHYQSDDVSDDVNSDFIQPCLNSLAILVNWYFNEYLRLDKQIEMSKESGIKKFSMDLKYKLIEETKLERLSFGLSLSTDDDQIIDMDHLYESIKRIDYIDYDKNKINSYRWLKVKNISENPTIGIYHMECGENKINFKQFSVRACIKSIDGIRLKVDNLIDLQPSFVQKVLIFFDRPLLPGESYEIFYRISWPDEIKSYSEKALSQSISLSRYFQGVKFLKYGLLEKNKVVNVIAEKTNKYFEQIVVNEIPKTFSVKDETELSPLHSSDYNGFLYEFENPDAHAYRFKYKLDNDQEEEENDEF